MWCARQVSWLAGLRGFAGLPSGYAPPVALVRERLAAYSCGVSSGIAARRRRTGFPLAPGHMAGDRERGLSYFDFVGLLLRRDGVGAALAVLEHSRAITGIPEVQVTGLTRPIDGGAGVQQLVGVSRLHDVDHLERFGAQRVGVRIPKSGVLLDLGLDLRR